MRSNWLDLFGCFLKGENFLPWFTRRCAVAEHEQHRSWKQARLETDIQQFLSKMSEIEVVDSFNAVERHLLEELQKSGSSGQDSSMKSCQKLQEDLLAVFNVLPKDIQQLLLMTPERAALVHGT